MQETINKFLLNVKRVGGVIDAWIAGDSNRLRQATGAGLLVVAAVTALPLSRTPSIGNYTFALIVALLTLSILLATMITINAVAQIAALTRAILDDWWLIKQMIGMVMLELDARIHFRTGKYYSELVTEAEKRTETNDYLRELFGKRSD